jgi:hypothetical protein
MRHFESTNNSVKYLIELSILFVRNTEELEKSVKSVENRVDHISTVVLEFILYEMS